MITLHHLNDSRSHRVLWLLEELNLEYQLKFYERDSETYLAPASLKKIHPLGKSPVLTDGAHTLVESGAIVEYLLDRYGKGKLRPISTSEEFLRYRFWLHYAEGSLMPPLLLSFIFQRIESAPMPFFVKPIAKGIVDKVKSIFIEPQLKLHLEYVDSELAKYVWCSGDEFTAADIQISFPIEASSSRDDITSKLQNIQRFLARIKERPAYKMAAVKIENMKKIQKESAKNLS